MTIPCDVTLEVVVWTAWFIEKIGSAEGVGWNGIVIGEGDGFLGLVTTLTIGGVGASNPDSVRARCLWFGNGSGGGSGAVG